jgi:hypothetical protein
MSELQYTPTKEMGDIRKDSASQSKQEPALLKTPATFMASAERQYHQLQASPLLSPPPNNLPFHNPTLSVHPQILSYGNSFSCQPVAGPVLFQTQNILPRLSTVGYYPQSFSAVPGNQLLSVSTVSSGQVVVPVPLIPIVTLSQKEYDDLQAWSQTVEKSQIAQGKDGAADSLLLKKPVTNITYFPEYLKAQEERERQRQSKRLDGSIQQESQLNRTVSREFKESMLPANPAE